MLNLQRIIISFIHGCDAKRKRRIHGCDEKRKRINLENGTGATVKIFIF
jgi:hypothetical protein